MLQLRVVGAGGHFDPIGFWAHSVPADGVGPPISGPCILGDGEAVVKDAISQSVAGTRSGSRIEEYGVAVCAVGAAGGAAAEVIVCPSRDINVGAAGGAVGVAYLPEQEHDGDGS